MEDNQSVRHDAEKCVSDESGTERANFRDELPPLLLGPVAEGSGRILRYRSGLSLRSPLSQPLIRQSGNFGANVSVNGPSINESRTFEQSGPEVLLPPVVNSSSVQPPEEVVEEFRDPLRNLGDSNSHAEVNPAGGDREAGLAISQSGYNGSLQTPSSAQSAYFTIGEQDDTQPQLDMSPRNDTILAIDPPQPPSYESICRRKFVSDSHCSSINTMDSLQPPTYRDAVGRRRYLEDAPPNYHALFAQSVFRMMDITNDIIGHTNDDEERSLCSRIMNYIFLSGVVIFVAGMAVPLPFAMITVGVTHLHSCPAQPRIPVFLTSLGVFQLLECVGRLSMYIYSKLRAHNHRDDTRYRSKDPFVYFIVVWFVVGSMWVYQNYPSCHEIIPKDVNNGLARGFDGTDLSANRTGLIANYLKLTTQNIQQYNGTLRPTFPNAGRSNKDMRAVTSKYHPVVWQTASTTSRPTTAGVPEERQKAACCGKVVYFFTFGIVTFYYSLVGILFLLQMCTSFVQLICRCRGQNRSV